jgi:hypothetical protein
MGACGDARHRLVFYQVLRLDWGRTFRDATKRKMNRSTPEGLLKPLRNCRAEEYVGYEVGNMQ